jgi:cellulose synthase/poly-beta-1,6-N-acetylglucosamine synthase-like glycosyltransferase
MPNFLPMMWIVVSLYIAALLFLFLFSLGQLQLTLQYVKARKADDAPPPKLTKLPVVTVQLPIFNEKYVVERLLDAVAQFNYPSDKLEIQILDDSTDETTEIIEKKIEQLRPLRLNIKLIHRQVREGFKAGALQNGFASAQGEYIAIFDADFVPPPDFLQRTLPYFADASVGVVQTRWAHLNEDYSLLTQLQAFGLNAHFSIEQNGRSAAGSFINFNGTCGVWRKATIADAGGWSPDTLTEDLDLSYRAQLRGWNFRYLEGLGTPGELPVIMPAVKSQQYRWNKGAAETARKLLGRVLASQASFRTKVHATLHLLNSAVFVGLLVAAALSVPMLYVKYRQPGLAWLFYAGNVFLVGFFSITIFYWVATTRFYEKPGRTFWRLYPRFLIVSMGLSLHNGLAVLEGWFGRKTPFIRTPKFSVVKRSDRWRGNEYVKVTLSMQTIFEALLCLYFCAGVALGIYLHDSGLLLFHVMLALGFGSVVYYSIMPVWNARWR